MYGDYLNEENRLKQSSSDLKFIGYPTDIFFDEVEQFNKLPKDKQDTVIKVMDNTIINLFHMLEEVINISGGIEPDTYFYHNPYATNEIYNYFYRDNQFRNNAIEYFNKTIEDYSNMCSENSIPSHLIRTLKVREEFSTGRLFDKMTLIESVILLEGVCYIITIDKKDYINRKTQANNGEHAGPR